VSLQILIREIERVLDCTVTLEHDDWREGDQLYFVADTRALKSVLDWAPRLTWREGLRDLADWLATSRFSKAQARRRVSA
jgi:CDP-paratose 2-epimerase